MRVRLDGHRMTVIAVDGIPTMPSTVDTVTLDLGERCDVIVEMNQPVGNYSLRASTSIPAARTACAPSCATPALRPPSPPPPPRTGARSLDYNALRARGGLRVPAADLVGARLLGGTMKPYRWTWDGRAFVAPKTSFRTEPDAADPASRRLR